MKLYQHKTQFETRCENASVLIIVLWVAIGLVSIALYFANSMTYELRAADNRMNGVAADQAIEGAARYVAMALQNFATNGAVPDSSQIKCEAVAVGDAKFWLIGRDPAEGTATEPYFGLVDEGGKLSLNHVSTNVFQYLPNMSADFAEAILDWRSTNGTISLNYASLGYSPKYAPFESVDELRLVYGATVDLLAGEDLNRNGILDKNEKDLNSNGSLDPGLFAYVTAWTREPNFHSDGTSLTNLNAGNLRTSDLTALLRDNGTSNPDQRAGQIYSYLHPPNNGPARTFNSVFDLAIYWRGQGWSADEFAKISDAVTTTTNIYFRGRLNVNTASSDVLTALFMGLNVDEQTADAAAQTMVTYREQNPDALNSVAWVYDALGGSSTVVQALQRGDYITTKSFQFTADIAAVGAFGRGYRRVKFIFDTSDGSPKILYRQDLSRLGWALGEKARQTLIAKNTQ